MAMVGTDDPNPSVPVLSGLLERLTGAPVDTYYKDFHGALSLISLNCKNKTMPINRGLDKQLMIHS